MPPPGRTVIGGLTDYGLIDIRGREFNIPLKPLAPLLERLGQSSIQLKVLRSVDDEPRECPCQQYLVEASFRHNMLSSTLPGARGGHTMIWVI